MKAAFEIKQAEYLPAGDYFEKLDDVEVYEIKNNLDYVNAFFFDNSGLFSQRAKYHLENLSLLCFILALGEGEAEMQAVDLSSMLEFLDILIVAEKNYREGKLEVIRENYSLFGGNKPIVKLNLK